MADPNPKTDDTDAEHEYVSPGTVEHAHRAVRALEAGGVPVDGVAFDPDADTFRVQLTNGFAGTDDDRDGVSPTAIGGGTIKS